MSLGALDALFASVSLSAEGMKTLASSTEGDGTFEGLIAAPETPPETPNAGLPPIPLPEGGTDPSTSFPSAVAYVIGLMAAESGAPEAASQDGMADLPEEAPVLAEEGEQAAGSLIPQDDGSAPVQGAGPADADNGGTSPSSASAAAPSGTAAARADAAAAPASSEDAVPFAGNPAGSTRTGGGAGHLLPPDAEPHPETVPFKDDAARPQVRSGDAPTPVEHKPAAVAASAGPGGDDPVSPDDAAAAPHRPAASEEPLAEASRRMAAVPPKAGASVAAMPDAEAPQPPLPPSAPHAVSRPGILAQMLGGPDAAGVIANDADATPPVAIAAGVSGPVTTAAQMPGEGKPGTAVVTPPETDAAVAPDPHAGEQDAMGQEAKGQEAGADMKRRGSPGPERAAAEAGEPSQPVAPAPQPRSFSALAERFALPEPILLTTSSAVAGALTQHAGLPQTAPVAMMAAEIAVRHRMGASQFEIRLDPPELGRIDVRLEVDRAGNVRSTLTVEKPETLDLLRHDVRNLERALEQAGLKSEPGSVSLSLKNDPGGFGQQARQFYQNQPQAMPQDRHADVPEQLAAAASQAPRSLGRSGGVDIHV